MIVIYANKIGGHKYFDNTLQDMCSRGRKEAPVIELIKNHCIIEKMSQKTRQTSKTLMMEGMAYIKALTTICNWIM